MLSTRVIGSFLAVVVTFTFGSPSHALGADDPQKIKRCAY